jgi:hypothetical protein
MQAVNALIREEHGYGAALTAAELTTAWASCQKRSNMSS